MNKERLLQLADVIENQSIGLEFDMNYYQHKVSCGTFACIAGHACAMQAGSADYNGNRAFDLAKDFLNLTVHQANELFTPDWIDWRGASEASEDRQLAANTIRDFVKTGVVEWAVEPPDGD